MAGNKKTRKDSKGRALRLGEYERPNASENSRYVYMYTDYSGKRISRYASDLPELRMIEEQITYDRHDDINTEQARNTTIDMMFDRYMGLKHDLKDNVRSNYLSAYMLHIRGGFGAKIITSVKYSDIKEFYYSFLVKGSMKASTLDNIHSLLHPTFEMAIRDGYIRTNPTQGVMTEIKKGKLWDRPKRSALTDDETKAFFSFLKENEEFGHWYNLFVIMYGTGMRAGEIAGLLWDNVDLDNNFTRVDHNVVYFCHEDGKCCFSYHDKPKTDAGIRDIPMLDFVREAFLDEYKFQEDVGFSSYEINGHRGFVFTNRNGTIHVPNVLNKALNRIIKAYNIKETEKAVKERRTPKLLPHFTCHTLRHTICARLCESETNIKFIQEFMGHKDITTTMDVYAEFGPKKKQDKVIELNDKIELC